MSWLGRARRGWWVGVGFCVVGWVGTWAGGQSAGPASGLGDLLARLQGNFSDYVRSVPNLFCDERVHSAMAPYLRQGPPSIATVSDSIFRLQRKAGAAGVARLAESRQIVRVDGKPVAKEELSGPSILFGVFASAPGLFSLVEAKCVRFQMRPQGLHLGPKRIVIEYRTLPDEEGDPACGLRPSTGRAWIDPETMQIRKIEVKTPNYPIQPGVKGDWDWVAEYDRVALGGRVFWLPKVITSTAVSYGTNQTEWTFTADYRNYHKMTASGRIVPGTVAEPVGDADGVKPQG